MTSVKTAITLDQELFEQVDAAAAEMKVSRSGLIAISLREYLQRRRNRQLLEQIDASYPDDAAQEDLAVVQAARGARRRVAERHS